jgi:hypothetical protein
VEGPGSIPGRGVNFALQGQQTTGLDSLDSKKAVWTAKSFLDSKKALWTAKKLVGQQNSSLDSKKLFVQQKSLLDSKKAPWAAKKLLGQQKKTIRGGRFWQQEAFLDLKFFLTAYIVHNQLPIFREEVKNIGH